MESKQGTIWGVVIAAVLLVIVILALSLHVLSLPENKPLDYTKVIIKPTILKGDTVLDDNETMPTPYVLKSEDSPLELVFGKDITYVKNKNKLEQAILENKTVTLTIVHDWIDYIYDVKINNI